MILASNKLSRQNFENFASYKERIILILLCHSYRIRERNSVAIKIKYVIRTFNSPKEFVASIMIKIFHR